MFLRPSAGLSPVVLERLDAALVLPPSPSGVNVMYCRRLASVCLLVLPSACATSHPQAGGPPPKNTPVNEARLAANHAPVYLSDLPPLWLSTFTDCACTRSCTTRGLSRRASALVPDPVPKRERESVLIRSVDSGSSVQRTPREPGSPRRCGDVPHCSADASSDTRAMVAPRAHATPAVAAAAAATRPAPSACPTPPATTCCPPSCWW